MDHPTYLTLARYLHLPNLDGQSVAETKYEGGENWGRFQTNSCEIPWWEICKKEVLLPDLQRVRLHPPHCTKPGRREGCRKSKSPHNTSFPAPLHLLDISHPGAPWLDASIYPGARPETQLIKDKDTVGSFNLGFHDRRQ